MFNGFVRALSRSLRTLVELTALNMLLQRHARRAREDLLDIALSLPFQADVNTGFGILGKVYLDALVMMHGERILDASDEGVAEAKEGALEICEETFGGIKNPRGEVERGFRFWDAVSDDLDVEQIRDIKNDIPPRPIEALAGVRSLARDQAMGELAGQFEQADTWLRPMRP